MNTFRLHILAADRVFFEGECTSLIVPTVHGQYGVQARHSNMIAALGARTAYLSLPGTRRNGWAGRFRRNDQGGGQRRAGAGGRGGTAGGHRRDSGPP